MLHTETVEGTTLELLTELMRDEKLANFNLAGGTALALYLGHRISIDLDLFAPNAFDASVLESYLTEKYDFRGDYLERNTLKGTIRNVKIDCIMFNYPYIENPVVTDEGIRLYGMKDIAAMKLSAIADNGTRLKDFIDVACLSTQLSLADMLQAYKEKFSSSNIVRPLKGLTFFNDINFKEPIQMMHGKYRWDRIEKRLRDMEKKNDKVFATFPL